MLYSKYGDLLSRKTSEFPYGEVLGKYDFSWGNKFSYFPSPSCNYCIMFL